MSKKTASNKNQNQSAPISKNSGSVKFVLPLLIAAGVAVLAIFQNSGSQSRTVETNPTGTRRKLDPSLQRGSKVVSEYLALRRKNIKQAGDHLIHHLGKFPDDDSVRLALVRHFIDIAIRKKNDQAGELKEFKNPQATGMNQVETLLSKKPQMPAALYYRGVLKNIKSTGSGDVDMFTAAESQNVDWQILYDFGRYKLEQNELEAGLGYLQKAFEKQGKTYVALKAEIGLCYYDNLEYKKAYPLLLAAVKKYPNNLKVRIALAEIEFDQGKYELAISNLECAETDAILRANRRFNPSQAWIVQIYSLLGKIYSKQDDMRKAARYYTKACEYDINKAKNAFKAALCYYWQKKYAKAMKFIDIAYKIDSSIKTIDVWRKRIEDKRFGKADLDTSNDSDSGKSLLDLGKSKEPDDKTGDLSNPLMPIGK